MAKRVLLGMSGGTDSSTSILYLREAGYEVVGVTFLFAGSEDREDVIRAVALADMLKIEHHIVDLRSEFKQIVIDYFVNEYANARTPFPCVVCNKHLKWPQLLKLAKQLSCDKIATGHYAGIKYYKGYPVISKGIDPDKDQSFFLWSIPKEILDYIIFPLEEVLKTDVRIKAQASGLENIAGQKDSMGICFSDEPDYRDYLKKFPEANASFLPGDFVDLQGNKLGRHNGLVGYTVGQRKGLGLNLNKPLFVNRMNRDKNQIVLSDFKDLFVNELLLKDYHLYVPFEEIKQLNMVIRIRYRGQHATGVVRVEDKGLRIVLDNAEWGIAPGQTAVLYYKNLVLGGGFVV